MLMKFVLSFLLALILTVLLNSIQLSEPIIYTIIFIIVFTILYVPLLYTLFFTTSIGRVEKFLLSKRKHPYYQLTYGLANKIDVEVEGAMPGVLRKYKLAQQKAMFQVIYALYKKDLTLAKEYVDQIKPESYKFYYQASIAIEEEDFTKASDYAKNLKKEWMRHTIESEIHLKQGNNELALKSALSAVSAAKGLQRYVLV